MQRFTGWIILGTLLCYLLNVAGWLPVAVPAAFAWTASALMWPGLKKNARKQSLLLLAPGLAAVVYAGLMGHWLPWQQLLAVNIPMLGMFVGVSFLALTNPENSDDLPAPPSGPRAIATTIAGAHLLGAVINLSVVFLFADRLQRKGTLTPAQQALVCRCFAAAAWWSPFFVATGVAMTYAPGLEWRDTIVPGLIMAMTGLLFTFWDVLRLSRQRQEDFEGYPLRAESLVMPAFLATTILIAHFLWSDISILVLIALMAPVGAMMFSRQKPLHKAVPRFITRQLPGIGSQFALFLAAGIFSAGIKALILVYPDVFSLDGFSLNTGLFAGVMAAMIIAGLMGVHPVVSIAVVSPILLPLNPEPAQLGFLYLSTWAIATPSSPLSGIGLAVTGRYRVSPASILRHNWQYCVFMWAVASAFHAAFLLP